MKSNLKLPLLLVSIFLMVVPVQTALALIVNGPGPVRIVDGADSGSGVDGIAFNVTSPSGYDFGYVTGSPGSLTFNSIASNSPVSGPVDVGLGTGSWSFTGGDIVNFALKQNFGSGDIFSIADGFGTLEFLDQVSGSGVNPGILIPYFNTLEISWNIPSLNFGLSILDAGSQFDGLTVVPIPPAALLFGTGLIGLIGIARRSLFVR